MTTDFESEDEEEEETTQENEMQGDSRVLYSFVKGADGFTWGQVSSTAGVHWWKMGTSDTRWDPQ